MELTQEQQRIATIAVAGLLTVSLAAMALWWLNDEDGTGDNGSSSTWRDSWVDPIARAADGSTLGGDGDGNHSHNELLDHWLWTENMTLIDYHNLNCDGELTSHERVCRPGAHE